MDEQAMAERRVTRTGKDDDGDITSLAGAWGSRSKSDAISDIESKSHHYYVQDGQGEQADVYVYSTSTGKHLRTDPNSSCADNLESLPDA